MTTLRLIETGRTTKRTGSDDADWWRCAADRLVARDWPGHFARFGSLGDIETGAEVCRAVGGMTEHTGTVVHFEIL